MTLGINQETVNKENESVIYDTERAEEAEKKQNYYENKHELVTRVAFLCGVQDRFFTDENSIFIREVYDEYSKTDRAMIVRNLCILRSSIEHNFKKINDAMYKDCRAFFSLEEYYPKEALSFVTENGIKISTGSRQLCDILSDINRAIGDRINNCKDLVPSWINWDYIKEMFIMPNGLNRNGMLEAARLFYDNMPCYPYGVYINWKPQEVGNLFLNDFKFATTLYKWHNDRFLDLSNLSDVSGEVKNKIYDFLDKSGKTILVVDCENSDPYSLCAMFNSLDDEQADKITRVILYDDPQAPSGWKFFEQHVNIELDKIEHIIIKRLLNNKSLLDVKLTARIVKECYSNRVESFVIVSSDSDFWGVIEEIPDARFLVMLEHRKTSPELVKMLSDCEIFYCYTDDFYTGMDDSLKKKAIFYEFASFFEEKQFNVKDLFEEVLIKTRAELPDGEKRQFYDKHLKNLVITVDKDGNARIDLKK